jgi:hypothetical protein
VIHLEIKGDYNSHYEMLSLLYPLVLNLGSKSQLYRMPSQHTPPLLPPILPTERPSLFGGRIESTPSALSIPQRQLWTLPSRTPSYDSMNSETYDHDSAQRSDIEKVKQLMSFIM